MISFSVSNFRLTVGSEFLSLLVIALIIAHDGNNSYYLLHFPYNTRLFTNDWVRYHLTAAKSLPTRRNTPLRGKVGLTPTNTVPETKSDFKHEAEL